MNHKIAVRFYPEHGGSARDEYLQLLDHAAVARLLGLAPDKRALYRVVRAWATTNGSVTLYAVCAGASADEGADEDASAEAIQVPTTHPRYAGNLFGSAFVYALAEHSGCYFAFDYKDVVCESDMDVLFESWGRMEALKASLGERQLAISARGALQPQVPLVPGFNMLMHLQNQSIVQQLLRPMELAFFSVDVPDNRVEDLVRRAEQDGISLLPFSLNY